MLVRTIKANYPGYDSSTENIERLCKYLWDFSYDTARSNVDKHIMTEKFAPNIAEIRGRQGEQLERQRMREETQAYFAKLDLWKRTAVPPPTGMREALHAQLSGTRADRSTE